MDALTILAGGDAEFFDHLREGIYVVDRDRRIVYWNAAAEAITGYLRQEVTGRLCYGNLLQHCSEEGEVLCDTGCPLSAVLHDGRPRESLVYLRHHHGHRIPVHVRARPLRNAAGEIAGVAEVFEVAVPVSAVPDPEPCTDPQTGAASRKRAEVRLGHMLAEAATFNLPLGWVRVDLEGMDTLERRFGHEAVEAALALGARTLRANLVSSDLLARWEPQSFRALVQRCTPGELAGLTRRLHQLLHASNLSWWGEPLSIKAGIRAVMAQHDDTIASLEARVAAARKAS